MPVEISKVMDAMSLPLAFRDRPRYQEMARILAHFADKIVAQGGADEGRILEYWFPLSCGSESSVPRKIYMNVPANTPSKDLAQALADDLDRGFFDGNEQSFKKYLEDAGVTFPLVLPEKASSAQLQQFDAGVPVDHMVMSCSGAPPQPSDTLKRFLADVWVSRDELAGMTAPQMAQWIYDNVYTQLSPPDKEGNLDAAGLSYLSSLRGVGGSTKKLTVLGARDVIPKKIVPEWCTVGAAAGVTRRVYVNVKAEHAAAAMQVVCDLMETNADVPHAKVAGPLHAGTRPDTIVVYTKNHAAAEAVVAALKRDVREEHFQERVPALTFKAAKGIGIANDPQPRTGESFGQSRSRLVAEAFYDLLARKDLPAATRQDLVDATAAHFVLNGLDPTKPYLDSADSYPDLMKPPAEPHRDEGRSHPDPPRQPVKHGRVILPPTAEEIATVQSMLRADVAPKERVTPPPVPARSGPPAPSSSVRNSPIANKLEGILAAQIKK